MVEKETQFIGITMPNWLAEDFKKESIERFGDCRWLTILFHRSLYNLMWCKTEPEMLQKIEEIRLECLKTIRELYMKGK